MSHHKNSLLGSFIAVLLAPVFVSGTALAVDDFIDVDFNPNLNGSANVVMLQPDGNILIGGDFSEVGSVPRGGMARISDDGSLVDDFDPNPGPGVDAIVYQDDGKLLIGGAFTNVRGGGRNCCFARLKTNGVIDITLNNALNSLVGSIEEQSNGGILVGLVSTFVDGIEFKGMVRIDNEGSVDTSFNPNIDFQVSTILEQNDGKILIGGAFENVGGVARNGLARLNSDGSLDLDFDPMPEHILANPAIYTIHEQSNGGILLGGFFTSFGGVARQGLARLSANGDLDLSFNPNIDGIVYAIAEQADGNILVGGLFDKVGRATRNNVARLSGGGVLDGYFNPNANGTVRALAHDSNEKIVIGGDFTQVGGVDRNYIARLEDRVLPQITLVESGSSFNEGDVGTTTVEFEVTRTIDTSGVSSLEFMVVAGSMAPADVNDFGGAFPQGVVTFLEGESSKTIAINVSGDFAIEADEYFSVIISNPTNAILGSSMTTGVILNDDVDPDDDGVVSAIDNCPSIRNSDQLNSDLDAVGNVCDDDDDNDMVLDEQDNCPLVANAGQANNDEDILGNACDPDDDNDGVDDLVDNCRFVANPNQLDTDEDLLGNNCDLDDDDDGIIDNEDNCPLTPNHGQLDINGNQVGDACEARDHSVCFTLIATGGKPVIICL